MFSATLSLSDPEDRKAEPQRKRAGMQELGKWEIPEKTRRPAASSGTFSTCENPGVEPPGIESGSPWLEARILTTTPPRPQDLCANSFTHALGGRNDVMVRILASHLGEPGSIPFVVAPRFSHMRIGGVFSGISKFPPPLHSGAAAHSPRFTLIGSQDLDAKFSPDPSPTRRTLPPSPLPAKFASFLASFACLKRLLISQNDRVSEVGMEQRRNARTGEMGDPRENPPTSGIVRHSSHMRKSGSDPPGIEPCSPSAYEFYLAWIELRRGVRAVTLWVWGWPDRVEGGILEFPLRGSLQEHQSICRMKPGLGLPCGSRTQRLAQRRCIQMLLSFTRRGFFPLPLPPAVRFQPLRSEMLPPWRVSRRVSRSLTCLSRPTREYAYPCWGPVNGEALSTAGSCGVKKQDHGRRSTGRAFGVADKMAPRAAIASGLYTSFPTSRPFPRNLFPITAARLAEVALRLAPDRCLSTLSEASRSITPPPRKIQASSPVIALLGGEGCRHR
ncbi:hypothetical protein PR048_031041 [Dryococelus australis]|uniref:Uncharacterized protein n=1 Tax=Dryococelus australis TaxID=614101 RepID=A0ABQ9G5B8_9NEOP|nr:hypothetical protein PR048_031041 [Dryococelus australis]